MMDKIVKKKELDNYSLPVTLENTFKIVNQLKKSVCKIKTKNCDGTGFFCKILYNGKELSVLITNYHVIDDNFIKENKNLAVTLNDDIEYKNIEIDINKKMIYTSNKYDITIIEIKKEKENINNYLEIDENIFNENPILNNESIYILQYSKYGKEQKAAISYGRFKQIEKDGYNINHYCSTDEGSSGSPILRLSNNKIIGIHKEGLEISKYNRGSFLKEPPINEFLNYIKTKKSNKIEDDFNVLKNSNEIPSIYFENINNSNNNYLKQNNSNILKKNNINCLNQNFNIKDKSHIIVKQNNKNNYIIAEIEIKEKDINKDIRIINSYEQCKREYKLKDSKEDYKNENEKEIKENCEIKINNIIMVFSYFYKFNKKGKYLIKYSFNNILSKINHMFNRCISLKNIDLSNFNTQNVNNISFMFYKCCSLTNINLSNFNTQNVTNMSNIFSGCSSLTNINLSNFNTQNVTNMSSMFSGCCSLTNINLSNFNTQNVNNMSSMFSGCCTFKTIKLSNFNTQNVTDMSDIFSVCSSLTNLNLSNLNTQNVNNMSGMFSYCNSLTNLDLSKFNTQNVTDMSSMFSGCCSLKTINLSNFNTQNVTNMNCIFLQCSSLKMENVIVKDKNIIKELNNI